MGDTDGATWHQQRSFAIAQHAAEHERRRAAETQRALRFVEEFTVEAHRRGLRVARLVARPYGGRGGYRTALRGWYVLRSRLLAISVEGGFYNLAVSPSLRSRLSGVSLQPQDPRLVVGEGGRDGESMPLEALLRQRLDAGDDWP